MSSKQIIIFEEKGEPKRIRKAAGRLKDKRPATTAHQLRHAAPPVTTPKPVTKTGSGARTAHDDLELLTGYSLTKNVCTDVSGSTRSLRALKGGHRKTTVSENALGR